jgi:protein SCO1/2
MRKNLFSQLGLGLLIGVVFVSVAAFVYTRPYNYQGSLIEPPIDATDFSLTDQNGDTFTLSDHKGSVVLLFFGYTNCPDVCPTTLYDFKQIKSNLGDQQDEVVFVFVTVDPERDTPDRLKEHLSNFDPSFIGLTGSIEEMEPVFDGFGVYRAKQDTKSELSYLMDHTARVYGIDPQGKLHITFPFGMIYEAMLDDIVHLLGEG